MQTTEDISISDSSINKDYFLFMVRNIVFVNFKHWSIKNFFLVCVAVSLFIFLLFFPMLFLVCFVNMHGNDIA